MPAPRPRRQSWLLLLVAVLAALLALDGQFGLIGERFGGSGAYFFEVGLPLLILLGVAWRAFVLWRDDERGSSDA